MKSWHVASLSTQDSIHILPQVRFQEKYSPKLKGKLQKPPQTWHSFDSLPQKRKQRQMGVIKTPPKKQKITDLIIRNKRIQYWNDLDEKVIKSMESTQMLDQI